MNFGEKCLICLVAEQIKENCYYYFTLINDVKNAKWLIYDISVVYMSFIVLIKFSF